MMQDKPLIAQVAVGVGLVVTHPLLDCVPHPHWFDYEQVGKLQHIIGAFVEVVGGLIIIPLSLVYVFWFRGELTPYLLTLGASYILCANLFDFLMLGFKRVKRINRWAHLRWEKRVLPEDLWTWEIGTTAVLTSTFFLLCDQYLPLV